LGSCRVQRSMATPDAEPINRDVAATMPKKMPRKLNESLLYTQDEDKGGWGRHDTFLRQALDSTNTAKSGFQSKSTRFKTPRAGVDQIYDIDSGSGNKRSMRLTVQESPRRLGAVFNETPRFSKDHTPATSALYDIGNNPISGTMEHKTEVTPRRYFGQFHSVVERGFDPRDGISGNVPDYDHGDGPKPAMSKLLKESPRKYCMMNSKEARGMDVDELVQPTQEYDTDTGAGLSIARRVELSGLEYSNMRSQVPRFDSSIEENPQDYRGQDSKTINKESKITPRRYHNIVTKTPRWDTSDDNQGGQDFYKVEVAHKKSISTGLATHPVRYGSSIGSQTARFPSEETGYGTMPGGDPDGMSYNTDTGLKMSFKKTVQASPRKYSQFRSKVPRFNADYMAKKKGKKLDMDAVYEAELKRVTGVREPAEYYIPNYGAHRGVSEMVKTSTRRYASSFQSKTPRFKGESTRMD